MKPFLRTAAVVAAFSIPLTSGYRTKAEDTKPVPAEANKTQGVKTKEVLDKERTQLKQQEGKLMDSFLELEQDFRYALFYIGPAIDSKEGRIKAHQTLTKLAEIGQEFINEVVSTPKEKMPSERSFELVVKIIKLTDTAIPFLEPFSKLSAEELNSTISKGYKNNTDINENDIADWVKDASREFTRYKRSVKEAKKETSKLIQDLEKFNEAAKAASQKSYEPRFKISLELLKSFQFLNKE